MSMIKKTESICPECLKKIDAWITSNTDRIYIEKECSTHGRFQDVYWSNKKDYDRAEKYRYDDNARSKVKIFIKQGRFVQHT